MLNRRRQSSLCIGVVGTCVILGLLCWLSGVPHSRSLSFYMDSPWNYCLNDTGKLGKISRFSPLIFVGGWARSGTTLMRIILDMNNEVRCGQESKVIPAVLDLYSKMSQSPNFQIRRPISADSLDIATVAFILEVMRHNGVAAKRYCSKDPFSLVFMNHLSRLFPNAKFIYMVRDGRAVVHSVYTRKIRIAKLNISNPWSILKLWNRDNQEMEQKCRLLGSEHCMLIKYEHLVLNPKYWIDKVADFLDIPRDPKMYSHADNMKMKKVMLNKFERSTDQVVKPIYKEAVYQWFNDGSLPHEFVLTAHKYAPMLRTLDYDISQLPPNYDN